MNKKTKTFLIKFLSDNKELALYRLEMACNDLKKGEAIPHYLEIVNKQATTFLDICSALFELKNSSDQVKKEKI